MITISSPADLAELIDQHLGYSDWVEVTQDRVDLFAEATGDHQWIHVDVDRAADGPFGGTIAHGYLTLSLAPLLLDGLRRVEGTRMGLNYGLEPASASRRRAGRDADAGRRSCSWTPTDVGDNGCSLVTRVTAFEVEGGPSRPASPSSCSATRSTADRATTHLVGPIPARSWHLRRGPLTPTPRDHMTPTPAATLALRAVASRRRRWAAAPKVSPAAGPASCRGAGRAPR